MASIYTKEYEDRDNYLKKYVTELQDKLKRSEDERMQLETKLGKLQKKYKSEDDLRKQIGLRDSYNLLLQQEKLRNDRSKNLKEILEKIENEACFLTAKTDRLRLLRQNYEAYMEQLYPGWRDGEDELYEIYRKKLDDISHFEPADYYNLKNYRKSPPTHGVQNTLNNNYEPISKNISESRAYSPTSVLPSQSTLSYNSPSVISSMNDTKMMQFPIATPTRLPSKLYRSTYVSEKPINDISMKSSYNFDMDKDENTKNNFFKDSKESFVKIQSPVTSSDVNDFKRSNLILNRDYTTDLTQKYKPPLTSMNKFTPRYLSRSNSSDNFSPNYLKNRYKEPNSGLTRARSFSYERNTYSTPLYRTGNFGIDRMSSYSLPRKSDIIKYDNHVESLYRKYVINSEDPNQTRYPISTFNKSNYMHRSILPRYDTSYYPRNLIYSDDSDSYKFGLNLPSEKNYEPYKIMRSYIKQPYPNISRSFSVSSLDDLDYLSRRERYSGLFQNKTYPSQDKTYDTTSSYLQNPFSKYPSKYLSRPVYNYSPYRGSFYIHKTDKATITDENMLNYRRKFEYRKPLRVHYADKLDDDYDDHDTYRTPTYSNSSTRNSNFREIIAEPVESTKDKIRHYGINDNSGEKITHRIPQIDYNKRYTENDNDLNTLEERTEEDTSLENPSLNSEEIWENKIDKLKELINYETSQPYESTSFQKELNNHEQDHSNNTQANYLPDIKKQNYNFSEGTENVPVYKSISNKEEEKNDKEKEFLNDANKSPISYNLKEADNFEMYRPNVSKQNTNKEDEYHDVTSNQKPVNTSHNPSLINDKSKSIINNGPSSNEFATNVGNEVKSNLKEAVNHASIKTKEHLRGNENPSNTTEKESEGGNDQIIQSEKLKEYHNNILLSDTQKEKEEKPGIGDEDNSTKIENNKLLADKNQEIIVTSTDVSTPVHGLKTEPVALNDSQQILPTASSENIQNTNISDTHTEGQKEGEIKDVEPNAFTGPEKDLQDPLYSEESVHYPLEQGNLIPDQQQYTYDQGDHYTADNAKYPPETQQYNDQDTAQYSENYNENQDHYPDAQYQEYPKEAIKYTAEQYQEESGLYPTDNTTPQYAQQNENYPQGILPYNETNADAQYKPTVEAQPQYDQQMYYENYDNQGNYQLNAEDQNLVPHYDENHKTEYSVDQSALDEPGKLQYQNQQNSGYQGEREMYDQNPHQPEIPAQTLSGQQNSSEYTPQQPNEQIQEYIEQPLEQQPTDYNNYQSEQQYDQYAYDENALKGDKNYPQYYEGDQYQTGDDRNPQYNPEQYAEYPQDQSGMQYQDPNYYNQYQGYENSEEFPQQHYDESKQLYDDPSYNYQNEQPDQSNVTGVGQPEMVPQTENVNAEFSKEPTVVSQIPEISQPAVEPVKGNEEHNKVAPEVSPKAEVSQPAIQSEKLNIEPSKGMPEHKTEVSPLTKSNEKESSKPAGNNIKPNATIGKTAETISSKNDKKEAPPLKTKKSDEKPSSQNKTKTTGEKNKASEQGKK